MKYLAIFKDSFREALDSKVFYVLLGLAGLLVLVALSLSFTPGPAKPLLQLATVPLYGELPDFTLQSWARLEKQYHEKRSDEVVFWDVAGSKPLDGASDGPASQYLVTLVVHYPTVNRAEQTRQTPQETLAWVRKQYGSAAGVRLFEVADVRLAGKDNAHLPNEPKPEDVYLELTTRPTSFTHRLWPHKISLFFGAWKLGGDESSPLALQVFFLLQIGVNRVGAWVVILVSIVITSLFIPNMLRKGTVDLLLVKPIHRGTLLVYKYLGGLLFILLITAIAVVGVWLAFGLRSGIWANYFLLSVFVVTFFFAVLYVVSTLCAVLTRSAIVAILVSCSVWFVIWLVGLRYDELTTPQAKQRQTEMPAQLRIEQDTPKEEREPEGAFDSFVRGAHFVLPRAKDLDYLMDQLLLADIVTANQISAGQLIPLSINWGESLTVSGLFIVVLLGLSCWIFIAKDF